MREKNTLNAVIVNFLISAVVLTAGCQSPTAVDTPVVVSTASSLGISGSYLGRANSTWNSCEKDDLVSIDANYDVYVLGDFIAPSADTQGRLAVGGNATLSSYSVGDQLALDASRINLLVNGNLNFDSGAVLNGRAVYGGSLINTSETASYQGGVSKEDHQSQFTSASQNVKDLSLQLGKFQPNGSVEADFSNGQDKSFLTLTGIDSTLNVFAMGVDDLQKSHTLQINAPSSSSAIINIYGVHGVFSSKAIQLSGVARDHIIFNFVDAIDLEISDISIEGSVLAPLASVSFPHGMLNGQFVGGSSTGSGQFNLAPFSGCLPHQLVVATPTPSPTSTPAPTPVPTPTPTPAPVIACGSANPWQQYNLLVFQDFTQSGTDTEGRMAIGGNATLSSYSVGAVLTSDSSRYDLIVGGNLSFISGSVGHGSIAYGNSAILQYLGLFGTSVQASPLNFSQLQTGAVAQSAAMAALTTNGTTLVQDWGGPAAQITLTGNDSSRNVFTVTSTDISRANAFTINAPASSTVIINITGTSAQMKNFGFSINGIARERVIFNFASASSLHLEGIGVQGTILAPAADISFQSGQSNGNLIGKSLTGNGQINYAPFLGCLPLN